MHDIRVCACCKVWTSHKTAIHMRFVLYADNFLIANTCKCVEGVIIFFVDKAKNTTDPFCCAHNFDEALHVHINKIRSCKKIFWWKTSHCKLWEYNKLSA